MENKVHLPEQYFQFNANILFFLGINIRPIKNYYAMLIYKGYSIFMISNLILFTIIEFFTFFEYTDISDMTFCLSYIFTHILGTTKVVMLFMKRTTLWHYFQKLQSDIFRPNLERGGMKEFYLIETAIRKCRLQGSFFYVFVVLVIGNRGLYAFFSRPVETSLFDPKLNATIIKMVPVLPFNTWAPFDYNISPYYELMFTYQITWTTIFGIYIGASDAIICGIYMHIKAQFLIVKASIDNFVERSKNILENEEMSLDRKLTLLPDNVQKYAWELVRKIVIHHQEITHFCNGVEIEFSYLMLLQFLSSLLIMCFQLFQMSLISPSKLDFWSMLAYYLLMCFQILCYCWHGNEVQIVSGQISRFAYQSEWLIVNDPIKKALLKMMMRAQKPIKFTAGKFAYLSLETYMAIIRGSGSYFMVLHQMNR